MAACLRGSNQESWLGLPHFHRREDGAGNKVKDPGVEISRPI